MGLVSHSLEAHLEDGLQGGGQITVPGTHDQIHGVGPYGGAEEVFRVVIPEGGEIDHSPRKGPRSAPGDVFLPYAPDDDLVPPIAHAGEGYKVHMTGLTHDERGYPLQTAEAHHTLVTRLVDKVRRNAPSIVDFEEYYLDDAEVVVVAYGCTARSARAAVDRARSEGHRCGLFRPKTIWPFPEERIRRLAEIGIARRIVVPEINLGQMRRELERLTQIPIDGLNHAGGAMPTPEAILEKITS